jgi:hypothetical protein
MSKTMATDGRTRSNRARGAAMCSGMVGWVITLGLVIGAAGSGVARAADPFVVVAMPDSQNYSEFYPATFTALTQWIANNATAMNIRFVSHTGDIVQNWNRQKEWTRAKTSMGILDTAGIPYGTVMGNHDGRSTYPSYYLNTFGPSFYQGRSWYGGASTSGLSNYEVISAGDRQFLFLHVQIDTPQVELNWAQGILNQNKDKLVVFSTHRYLMDYRVIQGRFFNYDIIDGRYETNGVLSETLFQNFIRTNRNIFMVLCGHVAGQYHQVSENNWGLPVYEILTDFDTYTPNGGNGWMRLLTFDTAARQIRVAMYSPTLGRLRVDGTKETHEDFQLTMVLLNDPNVIAEIADIAQSVDPSFDVDGYLDWLKADGGQNLWDTGYADGQRDSGFTVPVDFDAYIAYPHSLTMNTVNGSWGQVILNPEPNDANQPRYLHGTTVTLTAVPIEGKSFRQWEIGDPNHPNDANYAAIDTNNPLTLVMDRDMQVTAVFKCGSGAAQGLPLLVIGMTAIGIVSRHARRR